MCRWSSSFSSWLLLHCQAVGCSLFSQRTEWKCEDCTAAALATIWSRPLCHHWRSEGKKSKRSNWSRGRRRRKKGGTSTAAHSCLYHPLESPSSSSSSASSSGCAVCFSSFSLPSIPVVSRYLSPLSFRFLLSPSADPATSLSLALPRLPRLSPRFLHSRSSSAPAGSGTLSLLLPLPLSWSAFLFFLILFLLLFVFVFSPTSSVARWWACVSIHQWGHCENTSLPSSLLTISVSFLLFPLSRVFLFFFSLFFSHEMMNMLSMHQWGHYDGSERNELSLDRQISEPTSSVLSPSLFLFSPLPFSISFFLSLFIHSFIHSFVSLFIVHSSRSRIDSSRGIAGRTH